MRTALRTAVGLALAVPLLAPALPASASSTFMYRDRGSYADTWFEGSGTPGGVSGNYSVGSLTFHSTDLAEGFVDTFSCAKGQTPWGDQNGRNACKQTGSYYAWSQGFSVTTGKGKGSASTYSGTVDLYDAMTQDGALVKAGVPFAVTLTPSGATSKSTYTNTFKDPVSGYTYRSRDTQVTSYATAQGSLDGVPAVDGSIGTYSSQGMERIS